MVFADARLAGYFQQAADVVAARIAQKNAVKQLFPPGRVGFARDTRRHCAPFTQGAIQGPTHDRPGPFSAQRVKSAGNPGQSPLDAPHMNQDAHAFSLHRTRRLTSPRAVAESTVHSSPLSVVALPVSRVSGTSSA